MKNYSSNNIIQRTHKILDLGILLGKVANKDYIDTINDNQIIYENEKNNNDNESEKIFNNNKNQKILVNNKSNGYYENNTSSTSNNEISNLRKSMKAKLHNSISFGALNNNKGNNLNKINNNTNCTIVNNNYNNIKGKVNNFLYFSSKNLV